MNINNIHLSIILVISNFIYPNLWTTVIPCAAPRQWGGCLVAALTDDLDPGGWVCHSLAGFPSSSSIRKTARGIFGFAVFDYRVFKWPYISNHIDIHFFWNLPIGVQILTPGPFHLAPAAILWPEQASRNWTVFRKTTNVGKKLSLQWLIIILRTASSTLCTWMHASWDVSGIAASCFWLNLHPVRFHTLRFTRRSAFRWRHVENALWTPTTTRFACAVWTGAL